MTQLALAIFGLAALWLSMGHNPTGRKWAPLVGLCGQPAWIWFAYSAQAWGMFVLSLAYTAVYGRGIWLHWLSRSQQTASGSPLNARSD